MKETIGMLVGAIVFVFVIVMSDNLFVDCLAAFGAILCIVSAYLMHLCDIEIKKLQNGIK